MVRVLRLLILILKFFLLLLLAVLIDGKYEVDVLVLIDADA